MSPFRRATGTRWPPPRSRAIAAAAPAARRAAAPRAEGAPARTRRRSCATSAGSWSRCTGRGAFREDLLEEALRGRRRDRRAPRRDRRPAARRAARGTLRVRRADPARLALLPELRPVRRSPRRRGRRHVIVRRANGAEPCARRSARPRSPPPRRACPRCGDAAHAEPGLLRRAAGCGSRRSSGRIAALRRGWLRRFGWYPGDWIWVGAADAARRDRRRGGRDRAHRRRRDGGTTLVAARHDRSRAPRSCRAAAGGRPAGRARAGPARRPDDRGAAPGRRRTAASPGPRPRRLDDRARSRIPRRAAAARRSRPRAPCARASAFRRSACSTRPTSRASIRGYAIVFSGIYSSRARRRAGLTTARATGFGSAYAREDLPLAGVGSALLDCRFCCLERNHL